MNLSLLLGGYGEYGSVGGPGGLYGVGQKPPKAGTAFLGDWERFVVSKCIYINTL